jgi:hypothetical protein
LETAKSHVEPSEGSTTNDPLQSRLLLLKAARLDAKKAPARYSGEELMNHLFTTPTILIACASGMNKPSE